jgi:hypothetical protein
VFRPSLASGGLFEAAAGAAVAAGSLVLVLALVAGAAFAYKQLRGDGVEWPDEASDDEVTQGDSDDEWKYY